MSGDWATGRPGGWFAQFDSRHRREGSTTAFVALRSWQVIVLVLFRTLQMQWHSLRCHVSQGMIGKQGSVAVVEVRLPHRVAMVHRLCLTIIKIINNTIYIHRRLRILKFVGWHTGSSSK